MSSQQKIIEQYQNTKEYSEPKNDLVKSYLIDVINCDYDKMSNLKSLYKQELRHIRIFHNYEIKFDPESFHECLVKLSKKIKMKQFNKDVIDGVIDKGYVTLIRRKFQQKLNESFKSIEAFSLTEINVIEKEFYFHNRDEFFRYNNRNEDPIELAKRGYKIIVEQWNEHHNINIEVDYKSTSFEKWSKCYIL
ncbi:hypothetical protein JKY79_01715 [Candidatus Babeliales bacterium]|nr:hypothetical protein [Candidatus Babeliales bacterium]